VGADMRFAESGEGKQDSPFGFVSAPTQEEQEETGPRWMFIPVSEYLKAQGVEAASRVGFFSSSYRSSTGSLIAGKFVGVDRLDFPRVAFWRNDFASKSLGALMNELALRADGILVPSSFLAQNGLKVGDRMQLTVDTFGQRNQLDVEIVGTYNMFPSWYPANGPFFIGNLDYLFEMAGNLFPYQVWLDTKQDVDYKQLGDKELRKINIGIMNWDASAPIIDKVQRLPERQGVFGLLFIGFSAAAVLTVVGFLLFALFSYRRRFIELGVMRASGLSRRQMALYLASELLFLIVLGGVVGTVLGVWASSYYIPYLQIGTDAASMIPPFQVIIAWPEIFRIYQLFSGLFIITLVILVILLQRMKIFQAIKLGETV